MSRCTLGLFAPAMLLPLALAGQAPERGGFIVRLGNDTVAVERFSRTRTQLEGDVVSRSPRTTIVHYVATLGPTGRITRFESAMHAGATGLAGAPLQSSVVTMVGDTAVVELHGGARGERTMKVPVRPGAVPMPPLTFAFYEQMVRQARAEKKDSMLVDMVFPGAEKATQTRLIMRRDSAIVDLFGLPAYARLDNIGRVLNLDGRQTTDKVLVDRVDNVNADSLARAFGARESATGPLGPLSPRDTAHAMIGNAMVMVDYGRPHQRGRRIFGVVVPYGEVWRTGANAATQLITDHALVIGGTTVPAGTYTLWTLPSTTGAQLIINKQHGQWGTDYDPQQDLVRLPMKQTALSTPVEQFTIAVDPSGTTGGTLRLQWDVTEYSIPFTVQ
ncbi:MAG: DUF2911 domain-containing protein [Bacillota bacterium]